jgi:hypothetical protein
MASEPKKGVPIRRPVAAAALSAQSGGGSVAGVLGEAESDVDVWGEAAAAHQTAEADADAALEAAIQRASISAGRFEIPLGGDGDDDEEEEGDDEEEGGGAGGDDDYEGGGGGGGGGGGSRSRRRWATREDAGDDASASALAAAAATTAPPADSAAASSGASAPPVASSSVPPLDAARLTDPSLPVCLIMIGMAGSGKTTLLQRLNAEAHMRSKPSYIVNLDPAVAHVPYGPNVDIRDTVNYKEVMRQYGLGPNGGIVTSLNLFATRFDQVMGLLEARAPSLK